MTPPQVALRQISSSQDGLLRLLPDTGWDTEPLPGETPDEAAYRGAVDAATSILAAYDGGTAKHSDDVLTVAEAIADRLKVPDDEKKHLTAVAQLHDIGKILVSSDILNKPGPLTDDEWEAIRRHTIDGEEMLAAVPEISEVGALVRACHERYDGLGYPDGLAGEDIPLVARIVFCADAFHAMRCDRSYRAGRPVGDALDEMKTCAGTQFDPVVVAALCDVHATIAIQRKHGLGVLKSGARSRRLIALLATLTVSGSAMAATGAYKALPLVHDGDARSAATVTHAPVSGVKNPIFGTENSAAKRGDAGSGATAGPRTSSKSKGSSSAQPDTATASPRSGATPDPRGVSGTPGQVTSKPEKATPPKAKRPTNAPTATKEPKAKHPKANGPKLKLPKVKLPKVNSPKVTVPKVKVEAKLPKVKLPKLKAPKKP
jgi:hypothetical protein